MSLKFRSTYKIREKLRVKHRVSIAEVEEALNDPSLFQKRIGGTRRSQTATYLFVGRTLTGRLLRIIMISKPEGSWLKTALDAYDSDWHAYERRK